MDEQILSGQDQILLLNGLFIFPPPAVATNSPAISSKYLNDVITLPTLSEKTEMEMIEIYLTH